MPKRRQPPTLADAKRETDRVVGEIYFNTASAYERALKKLRRPSGAGHQPLLVSQYLPQVVLLVAILITVFDISVTIGALHTNPT